MTKCAVCGLEYEPQDPDYYYCPRCLWVKDWVQEEHDDWDACENRLSLRQAREAWARGEDTRGKKIR